MYLTWYDVYLQVHLDAARRDGAVHADPTQEDVVVDREDNRLVSRPFALSALRRHPLHHHREPRHHRLRRAGTAVI